MQEGGKANFGIPGANANPFPPQTPPPISPNTVPINTAPQNPATPIPPQQVIAPTNNFIPQQPPVMPSTGDIILVPDEPKKSNKPLIITIIVLATLALIAGIAFAIYQSTSNSSDTPVSQINLPPREAYDRFADYIIWGPEKNTDIGEEIKRSNIPAEDTYLATLSQTSSYDKHQTGFNTIYDNLDILRRSVDGDETLSSKITTLSDNLTELDYLSAIGNTDIILRKYLEGGEDAVKEYLATAPDDSSPDAKYFTNVLLSKYLELYSTLDEKGCIRQEIEDLLDIECYDSATDEYIEQLQDNIDSIERQIRDYITFIASATIKLTDSIQEEVYD